jgi:riboflavin kinase / FMN adenylyltransferase
MTVFRAKYNSIPTQVRRCALSIGNFDGVHRGHQAILSELTRSAKSLSIQSVAVTFDPPPAKLLRPDYQANLLTTFDDRAALIQSHGVDHVVIIETCRDLLSLTAEEFFNDILLQQFQTCAMVEGPNFHFGKNRTGTPERLRQLTRDASIELTIVAEQNFDGDMISSSTVRHAIQSGDIAHANAMLGRKYSIAGVVEHGLARGRTIGFPTANLGGISVVIPNHGVYACQTVIDGKPYAVATHIGPNASFGETESKVESHIIDFDGDLYGRELVIDFTSKLRNTQKFASVEELISQMRIDVAKAAQIFD